MALTALVVDDERLARNRLKRMLANEGVEIVGEAEDGEQAIALSQSTSADLLFIDINMPRKDGLRAAAEIAEIVEQPPAIIFCTAYDEYALKAFESNASSYLLKPVSQEDLSNAITRAGRLTKMQVERLGTGAREQSADLVVRSSTGIERFPLDEVFCFRSIDKHVYAYIENRGECLIDQTLKELQDAFPEQFVRTHRSSLANRERLSSLLRGDDGGYQLSIVGCEVALPVSRRHLSEVKKCIAR